MSLLARSRGGCCTDGRVDVLNRFPVLDSEEQTCHVMKYIFPRQFGLQNVFDSTKNHDSSISTTVREQEISQLLQKQQAQRAPLKAELPDGNKEPLLTKLPRRLRGQPVELVRKFRARHSTCQYDKLLEHYCPGEVRNLTQMSSLPCNLTSLVFGSMEDEIRSAECDR